VEAGSALAGSGILGGATTIQAGAALSPGTSVGTLTVNNNLTLQGAVLMEVGRDGAVLTNDLVTGINTNTYGGTLVVTNIGGSTMQVGDSFQLFAATNYAGTFANIVYPDGYTFTNSLAVDGRIWVASAPVTTSPGFPPGAVATLPDGNISLTVTGALNTAYTLWASTNVAATPITSTWSNLGSGTINASPFTIDDLDATNHPQRFYLFSTP
jgi:outer membrane autotransporter protein